MPELGTTTFALIDGETYKVEKITSDAVICRDMEGNVFVVEVDDVEEFEEDIG